ncbi:MAG: glutamine amidotransferase family protein [Candidatus Bathyarchaeota archaeon]|nr:glutamine amidotransferase family protein [Candidatus Bathyarchaeota archaeon]
MNEHDRKIINPYGHDKDFSGCSIFGMMDLEGKRFSSRDPVAAIANMHDRGNGLGGGFAVYGIYPRYKDYYAFHIMYLSPEAKEKTEKILSSCFTIVHEEEMQTKPANVIDPPLLWRYFVEPKPSLLKGALNEEECIINAVMRINTETGKAFVFSSGKDMGVFKGVGFPEDIADFFCLEEYQGYLWTCHGRFPTNTPGWWGGAHPFNILDWTVVHNGEISSYGINRRYLEMFGYKCTLQTDTEVVAYAFDLLMRRQRLPIELVAQIMAPPFWSEIDASQTKQSQLAKVLRQTYGSLLMNGPFSVVVAQHGEMIGLTDRVKLRPMIAATKGDLLYLSSEEASIRLVSPQLDRLWTPKGGEPVIGRIGGKKLIESIPTLEAHQ